MTFLRVVIVGFLVLESTNVLALYFFPDTWYANSVGVFRAWGDSKKHPQAHDFARYMVNWVAGTKLIFIALLMVLLLMADDRVVIAASAATAVAISSFYWRLLPLARKIDRDGQMEPKGYSAGLGAMIGVFIALFVAAIAVALAA